jgi:hypothetical protein
VHIQEVASFAEAWIETLMPASPMLTHPRRLLRGGVDRNTARKGWLKQNVGSPPSRRRGSKPPTPSAAISASASPPSRRRGSKLSHGVGIGVFVVSPPSRRRGSKHLPLGISQIGEDVASFAEAWIETPGSRRSCPPDDVASFAEAWIETHRAADDRGGLGVASFAEAWIETAPAQLGATSSWSPPSRRCGSKPHELGKQEQGSCRLSAEALISTDVERGMRSHAFVRLHPFVLAALLRQVIPPDCKIL